MMLRRAATVLAGALLLLVPAAGHAALSDYFQDFETMILSDPLALSSDGWVVYGNVYNGTTMAYMYGYGPFPAPNNPASPAFCALATGEGGATQGAQQISVYSDYNNADHANGNWIESNVYREWTIGAADVGTTWVLAFDAKLGNLVAPSTAYAFIKTLNPAAGWATTNFRKVETTAIPATWANYWTFLPIDASLVGQILQIGFANLTTSYVSSGVFYDNVTFAKLVPNGVGDAPGRLALDLRAPAPNPSAGPTRIEYANAVRGAADLSVFDVTGRRVATLFHGALEAGPHAATWDGRSSDGRHAPTGVYRCVLTTSAGVRARTLVLTR